MENNEHKIHDAEILDDNEQPFGFDFESKEDELPAQVNTFYNSIDKELQDDYINDLKKDMQGIHAARVNSILSTMDDKKFMETYLSLAEYFMPKLQRVQGGNANDDKDFVLNVKVVSNKENIEKEVDEEQSDK